MSISVKKEETTPALLTAVGARLMIGKGMPANKRLAIQIWNFTANAFNYGPAYSCLAEAWYRGDGVRADPTRAFVMSAKAVECGWVSRERTIAEAYEFGIESGWPVKQDLPRAATFWASLASRNDLTSLRNFFRLCGNLSSSQTGDAEKWAVIDAVLPQNRPDSPALGDAGENVLSIFKDLDAIAMKRDTKALNRFFESCESLWTEGKSETMLLIAKAMGLASPHRQLPRLCKRAECLCR